ncbi:MAG: hypothetical protein ACK5ES_01060, partial [Planctomyces sp.]
MKNNRNGITLLARINSFTQGDSLMNLYHPTLIASLLALFSQASLPAQDAPKEKPANSDLPASDSA